MTNWYVDIYPCRACTECGYLGQVCYKEHKTTFVDGCSKCGKMVNREWYYNEVKCPDFKEKHFSDPSGS